MRTGCRDFERTSLGGCRIEFERVCGDGEHQITYRRVSKFDPATGAGEGTGTTTMVQNWRAGPYDGPVTCTMVTKFTWKKL